MRTIEAALKNFKEQLLIVPTVKNKHSFVARPYTIVLGMGGSRLAADLLFVHTPTLPLIVHSDYGLPALPENMYSQASVIACSFSGNTEETLDGFERAIERGLHVAAITTGGSLLERAREIGAAYAIVPNDVPQPRFGTGYFVRALLEFIGSDQSIRELHECAANFNSNEMQRAGAELAAKLENRIPIMYSSKRNAPLGYNWKIRLNETAKIPAFANVLPEANHNELQSFEIEKLAKHFFALFLIDESDDDRITHRMHHTAALYQEKGILSEFILLEGHGFQKIFSALMYADWTSLSLAHLQGMEAIRVPAIEGFKKKLQSTQ